MLKKTFLTLLWASMLATAATPNFILGFDYSQWLVPNPRAMATDASGAIYVLSTADLNGLNTQPSSVIKLSPDGKTVVWQNQLPMGVNQMAVDPSGGVYVTPVSPAGAITVVKLNDGGSGIAWTSPILMSVLPGFGPPLSVDASGRTYLAGIEASVFGGKIVRVAANGSAIEYSIPVAGQPTSIAVDATGAAFITANTAAGTALVARFAPDGTPGFNVSIPATERLLLDPKGNVVVNAHGKLIRLDATGAAVSSTVIDPPNSYSFASTFALDNAGNAYVEGSSKSAYYPMKNSLAPCGTEFLIVVAPDGSILQTTYLPGATYNNAVYNANTVLPFVVGKDGDVLIAAWPSSTSAPSRPGPLPAGQAPATSFLLSLSPTAPADIDSLACMTNAADHTLGSISPGELVTLLGNGLGPQQGVETNATLQSPYPTKVADVQVTFDGTPAPILWAQDRQLNVVAPWSLNTTKDTQVCVTYSGAALKCLTWPTARVSPGVFQNYTGGTAVAWNEDGSVNSPMNRAAQGSLVTVFATGLGPITPQQIDGSLINLPLPNHVIAATVEGETYSAGGGALGGFGPNITFTWYPVDVTYSGPAPFRIAGISQINFRLTSPLGPYRVKLLTSDGKTFYSQPFDFYQGAK